MQSDMPDAGHINLHRIDLHIVARYNYNERIA